MGSMVMVATAYNRRAAVAFSQASRSNKAGNAWNTMGVPRALRQLELQTEMRLRLQAEVLGLQVEVGRMQAQLRQKVRQLKAVAAREGLAQKQYNLARKQAHQWNKMKHAAQVRGELAARNAINRRGNNAARRLMLTGVAARAA